MSGLDSGRVERRGQGPAGSAGLHQEKLLAGGKRLKLKCLVHLGDRWSRLRAELREAAATHLDPRGSQGTLGGRRAYRHQALPAGRLLPLEAERRPDDRVELKEEEQRQDQPHAVL